MPKYNVDIATNGTATFYDIEADSEEEAVKKAWEAMEGGRDPDEHTWEYGHLFEGCGDAAEATELTTTTSDEGVSK